MHATIKPRVRLEPKPRVKPDNNFKLYNYYKDCPNQTYRYRQNANDLALQHPSYSLMVGASGTGKTLALMNAILTPDVRMQWDRIWIFARFINEPLYQLIQTRVDEYQDKYEHKIDEQLPYRMCMMSDDLSTLPTADEMKELISSDKQVLLIFDDLMMADSKSMKMIVDYYTWVRKCNVSVFFLAQHNTDVSRIIRSNLTYAIIFLQTALKKLTSSHVITRHR